MSARPLSADERILWGRVARSAVPLAGKSVAAEIFEDENFARLLDAPPPPHPRRGESSPPARPEKPHPPRLHRIEAPTRQKLASGRLPLEGKVDLHGLTQVEAHALLLSFLHRAYADGRRHVLVVTGKGLSTGGDGVLRRAVPGWFATPPFRALVSGHEEAVRRHGGEGALYVRLRRPETRGPEMRRP